MSNILYSLPSLPITLCDFKFPLCSHFSLDELTTSSITSRQDSNVEYLLANSSLFPKLHRLAVVLELIRRCCGFPLTINSALRSPCCNAAVGGAVSSDHLTGDAADISLSVLDSKSKDKLRNVVHSFHELGAFRYVKYTSTYIHISLHA